MFCPKDYVHFKSIFVYRAIHPVARFMLCRKLGLGMVRARGGGLYRSYSFNNFTLSNVATCGGDVPNGSALTPDNGNSIVLTGSNSGSGCAATTTLMATAAAAGTVQFSYSYSSLDTPGADFAGYLRNSVFTQLADTNGQSGTVMFPVSSGQTFGFEAGTQDNTGEPGVLTVTNFSGPLGATAVPEPGTGILGLTGALAMALAGKKIVAANLLKKVKA
ncbi:MAG: hypothetical protein M3Z23_01010 [Acidobacteriota bacterium]|nr:hypothetical protein [Acidobacteriota bacterium]